MLHNCSTKLIKTLIFKCNKLYGVAWVPWTDYKTAPSDSARVLAWATIFEHGPCLPLTVTVTALFLPLLRLFVRCCPLASSV